MQRPRHQMASAPRTAEDVAWDSGEESDDYRTGAKGRGSSAPGSAAAGHWEARDLVAEPRSDTAHAIDVNRGRYPYAIVWTPIPLITWLLPFVGHMGICDSRGVAYDFAGPYTIGIDDLAFGATTRYLTLDPARAGVKDPKRSPRQLWDDAIDDGAAVYCQRMHNLCCDNCHSHVARCLNVMRYNNASNWNMVKLAVWMFFFGRYVSVGRAIAAWAPFVIIVTLIVLLRVFLGGK